MLNQFLNDDINYDVLTDLDPIAMVAQYQVGLLVRNDAPLQNLQDILDYVKKTRVQHIAPPELEHHSTSLWSA